MNENQLFKTMKKASTYLCCLLILSGCQTSHPAEDIILPPLFSDHMVLQRDANVKIWGKASPNSKVKVVFKNQKAEIISSEDSSWVITLAPEPAGGPFDLEISGAKTMTFSDVLLGEVWIASGQSNMEWSVQASDHAAEEISSATDDQIRLLTVRKTIAEKPSSHLPSDGWQVNSPETIPGFSAVAYFFGRVLRDSLDVPIGLIHSSWGGTRAEAWTSGASLINHPDYAEVVQTMQANAESSGIEASAENWQQAIENLDQELQGEGGPAWSAKDLDDGSWENMALPQLWEDAGLTNFDGIVWFRKSFGLPDSWNDQDLTLELAQIDDIDETWVNGIKVGETAVYNEPRKYTVPASVLNSGKNKIAVRVLDTGGGGGIYGEAANMKISISNNVSESISLAGTWKFEQSVDLNDKRLPRRPSGAQHTPTVLYNAMIHPLVPYTVKGAIWYQGESNASRAHQYQTLFPLLIEDWRAKWNLPLSFHFVQLANFMKVQENPSEKETWPELREAQTMALNLAQTGMAVTIDIGEADDIHPTNKQDVGLRLALSALNEAYGHDVVPAGPLYSSFSTEGDKIRIQFTNAPNGLQTSRMAGSTQSLKGFAISGEDQIFHWAEAQIDGSEVIVSSSKVASPVAVRYGWANNPIVNLYNTEGLPASPFRTDTWPGITVGVK